MYHVLFQQVIPRFLIPHLGNHGLQAGVHRHGGPKTVVREERGKENQGDVLPIMVVKGNGYPKKEEGNDSATKKDAIKVNQSHKEVNGNLMKCGHLTLMFMYLLCQLPKASNRCTP